jgi:predicted small lipoprotein YifL
MNAARLCALLGALLVTAGCGQKGALFLPDPAPQAVPAPAPGSATPEAAPNATPDATPDATSATAPAATPADDAAARRKTPSTPDPATAR